jgi:sarcosine oxidase
MERFDAIVVGVGGMGSAALHRLAVRGIKVCGLEQFEIGHDRGSSHGATRIIRKAYFEHPDYVPLLNRAYAMWDRVEEESSVSLVDWTGLLLAGEQDGDVIVGTLEAAKRHSLDVEQFSVQEATRRFPGLSLDEDMTCLFERRAGYLRVEDCVRVQVGLAEQFGATVLTNCVVRGWRRDGDSFVVDADGHRLAADRLIFCSGAWSRRLLADLDVPLEVRRKVVFWMNAPAAFEREAGFPVFGVELRSGRFALLPSEGLEPFDRLFFYGFPVIDSKGMKLGLHTGGNTVVEPSEIDRSLRGADLSPVQRFLGKYMPEVDQEPLNHAVCMYTMTPDEHFIVDRHPVHPGISFAAGFSGHGFKFAPLVGSVLADLAIDGATEEPISFLSIGRFGQY